MVEVTRLKNGLRVVSEQNEALRSACVGVWVKAGSMLENERNNGISHLMEHMSFKGTEKRTAKQLAEDMDAVGGQMNAATGRANTVYFARVLDTELENTLEILGDMICSPALQREELERERGVVLEEIAMAEDSPEDVIFDKMNEALYGEGTLARTILGTKENIARYQREDLISYREKYYVPENALIAVAGHFDKAALIEWAEKYFGAWTGGGETGYPDNIANASPRVITVDKPIEQVHLCLGWRGVSEGDDAGYALALMSNILGGGMSSRLFQKVREELGLVYSVYTVGAGYPGCGDFDIYAAATPGKAEQVVDAVFRETESFLRGGVTEKELEQAKIQLKTGIVLAQESAYHRMNRIGSSELTFHRYVPVEEVLQKTDAVGREDIMAMARRVFEAPFSAAAVGPKAGKLRKKLEAK